MALATGGSAVGLTTIKSSPSSCALRTAAGVGMTSTVPSGKTARTSRARIASFTFSRILGRRGEKPLGGYMPVLTESAGARIADYGMDQKQFLMTSVQDFTAFAYMCNASEISYQESLSHP